ncbi:MAG: carboxylesterase family protein, partial [Vicinamibacterales bacterium]
MRWILRLACVTCAVVAVSGNAESLPLVIRVASGSLRGSGSGVIAFKGIPYAAPPTGNLRWRPPAPPA